MKAKWFWALLLCYIDLLATTIEASKCQVRGDLDVLNNKITYLGNKGENFVTFSQQSFPPKNIFEVHSWNLSLVFRGEGTTTKKKQRAFKGNIL